MGRIFSKCRHSKLDRGLALFIVVWLSLGNVSWALAEEAVEASETAAATATPEVGTSSDNGAVGCTGAGCDQGFGQGAGQGGNQGLDQGGPTLEDIGATLDENGNLVLPAGVTNTTRGAGQGANQGSSNGLTGTNSNTGANSTNTVGVDTDSSVGNTITNNVTDTTTAGLTGSTGSNTQNMNTNTQGITTGNAGIGVTQVKNDNTATIGGSAGLAVTGYNGSYSGDLNIGYGTTTANLAGAGGGSIRAINDTTGSNSTNEVDISTRTEELNEVQNDGIIRNLLDLAAITGKNEASLNTSDGSITTGDANVAATLVNLLNSTVINGNLWITVADIFGDLAGNINLPSFAELAALLPAETQDLLIHADNEQTGATSTNTIDIDVSDKEKTTITNEAKITTTVDAEAITGQNEALANTGGGLIDTGDGSVSASNISLANTTVEGGNWALVVVNALNRWLGFLVGEGGAVRALSQNETLQEIEARNSATGENSTNTIDIDLERKRTTEVANNAEIVNEINASAITGQNEANKNTGQGKIITGNANIAATTVNIANTTVKDGSLLIAVVNIFGDWFGDLVYSGQSLLASAGHSRPMVNVEASNSETGATSTNEIDVDVNRRHETVVDNEADLATTLNANIDTGSNKVNKNTTGASITTGDGLLALHSRAVANLTGVSIVPGLGLSISGLNDTTGFNSKNKIRAEVNDKRVIDITNDANVSTVFGAMANTGNNEANQNTIGGNIVTGDAAANLGIHNLINRVWLVLTGENGPLVAAGEHIILDADFINRLTGALSENSNEVALSADLLIDILNDGVVDNVIDLLLNTGGNTANENTAGGNILSGAGCLSGDLENTVNHNTLAGLEGASVTLDNDAAVHNSADIQVTTGSNETNDNTGSSEPPLAPRGACAPELAVVVPSPTVEPSPEDVPEEEEAKEEEEQEEEEQGEEEEQEAPRVAAVTKHVPPSGIGGIDGGLLRRFPMAGGQSLARWLLARQQLMWPLFMVGVIAVLATSYYLDKRSIRHQEQVPALA